MPYTDNPDGPRRWVYDRRAESIGDQVRKAAELLAQDVEAYLYDEASDVWMKPEFLAWAVARYDIQKTGSGNYAQMDLQYNHDEAVLDPVVPAAQRQSPNTNIDTAVRFPEHARQAKHINTDEKKAGDK